MRSVWARQPPSASPRNVFHFRDMYCSCSQWCPCSQQHQRDATCCREPPPPTSSSFFQMDAVRVAARVECNWNQWRLPGKFQHPYVGAGIGTEEAAVLPKRVLVSHGFSIVQGRLNCKCQLRKRRATDQTREAFARLHCSD
jgi:hypothetical protein